MTKEYKTQRGALLDQLEHHCVEPGVWIVEGRDVQRRRDGRWFVEGISDRLGWVDSFTEALEWIASKTV